MKRVAKKIMAGMLAVSLVLSSENFVFARTSEGGHSHNSKHECGSEIKESIKDSVTTYLTETAEDTTEDIVEDVTEETPEDVTEETPEDVTEETPEDVTEETPEDVTEDSEVVEEPKIVKIICTSKRKVKVDFKGKVKYTDALNVVIVDEEGTEIPCKVKKKKKGMLTLKTSGIVKGQTYTITIDGVIMKGATEAETITKTFVAKRMKTHCKAKKVKKHH